MKEVKADILAIEAGLQTETESLAQRGRDFDETLAQREREAIAKAASDKRIADKRAELGLTPVVPQPAESEPSEDTADAPA
jgi:capsid protein